MNDWWAIRVRFNETDLVLNGFMYKGAFSRVLVKVERYELMDAIIISD